MAAGTNLRETMDFDPSSPSNSVSVIIPVYNGAKFIAQTLDSILAQTVLPTEIIVVNDGSTDESSPILREYGSSIILIETPNPGVCASRNLGASLATSNWLAFCDQDDLWLPTKLEAQLRLANECPELDFILTDFADVAEGIVGNRSHLSYAPTGFWTPEQHESGFVVRESVTGKLTVFQPCITSTPIIKSRLFHGVGGFDLEANRFTTEDTCLHIRCLSSVPFGVIPKVLMHYRRHANQVSTDNLKQLRNTVLVWDYIIANYPQAQPYRSELLQGLAAMRKEVSETARYQRRQKLKSLLRVS
jgi:glycosyltransferase involved in cell wall biosynthesis